MTRIITVRHGQSEANAQQRFAGHSDFDLTSLGHEQARLAAKYLVKCQKVDRIYSSDLLRAHNTAVPFAREYGVQINDTAELRELYAGAWEGLELTRIAELYTDDLICWRDRFSDARCTEGESVAELYARIVSAVKKIAKENDGKTLLLATHATPIRAIECNARGFDATHMHEIPFVRNSAISVFEYCSDTDMLSVVSVDCVEHLDESLVTAVPTKLKN